MARRDGSGNVVRFAPIDSDAEWADLGWAEAPEPLTAAPKLAATISIRLDPAAALLVRQAARLSGLTKSAFVRRAAVGAAKTAIDRAGTPRIEITAFRQLPEPTTRSGALMIDHSSVSARTGAPVETR